MRLNVELRDKAGTLLHQFSDDRAELRLLGLFDNVFDMTIIIDETVDPFVAAHLDEIVGIAAAGLAWRRNAKEPHPTPASQRESFKQFIRYTTVLDTVSPEVRDWLRTRVPKTEVKLMEGG